MERLPAEVIQRILLWTKEYARDGKEPTHVSQRHLAKLMRVSSTMQMHVAPILYRKVYIRDLTHFAAGISQFPSSSDKHSARTRQPAPRLIKRYTKNALVNMTEEATLDLAPQGCSAISVTQHVLQHILARLRQAPAPFNLRADGDPPPVPVHASCEARDHMGGLTGMSPTTGQASLSPFIEVNTIHDVDLLSSVGGQIIPGCSNRVLIASDPPYDSGHASFPTFRFTPSPPRGSEDFVQRYNKHPELLRHTTLVVYLAPDLQGSREVVIFVLRPRRTSGHSWVIAYRKTISKSDLARLCPPCTVCGRGLTDGPDPKGGPHDASSSNLV